MSDQHDVVMVCGHAGCLKTTLSLWVAPRLSINLVATYGMGPFSGETGQRLREIQEERYRHVAAVCETYVSRGLSVWIDGTFSQRSWRNSIWSTVEDFDVDRVTIVKCICGDEAELEKRFRNRRLEKAQPDSAADTIKAYRGTRRRFDPLAKDELSVINARTDMLIFDSCLRRLRGKEAHGTGLTHSIIDQMVAGEFISERP